MSLGIYILSQTGLIGAGWKMRKDSSAKTSAAPKRIFHATPTIPSVNVYITLADVTGGVFSSPVYSVKSEQTFCPRHFPIVFERSHVWTYEGKNKSKLKNIGQASFLWLNSN
jgi:hypothetical protein